MEFDQERCGSETLFAALWDTGLTEQALRLSAKIQGDRAGGRIGFVQFTGRATYAEVANEMPDWMREVIEEMRAGSSD